jgi:hypothetical protein
MTLSEFTATLGDATVPAALQPALQALWYDARGDWGAAHRVAQEIETPDGAWVHAYLHRKEGDAANARYWYQRAGRAVALDGLEQEWRRIVAALLV